MTDGTPAAMQVSTSPSTEALGMMIDPNADETAYIREEGEAAVPLMPHNKHCSAVKYQVYGSTAPRPGSLAEVLGMMIDPNADERAYIRKQGEAPTPLMPFNQHCSAVKYHKILSNGGPTSAPRPGSLAEALGMLIDPNADEHAYIRKQGEAPTPLMPYNENCSAVKVRYRSRICYNFSVF